MADRKAPPATIDYPTIQIKYNDLFNLKELYVLMFAWLKENGWKDKTTGEDTEYMEEFYLERTGPTGAKDHIIYWDVEKMVSDYFKYSMSISINTLFLNPTEVMSNGQKVKTNVGEVKIQITPKLHPDYNADWENHWILGSLHPLMVKTFLKNGYIYHKAELYKAVYQFQGEIKRYLKLKQFMPETEEGFIPEKQV